MALLDALLSATAQFESDESYLASKLQTSGLAQEALDGTFEAGLADFYCWLYSAGGMSAELRQSLESDAGLSVTQICEIAGQDIAALEDAVLKANLQSRREVWQAEYDNYMQLLQGLALISASLGRISLDLSRAVLAAEVQLARATQERDALTIQRYRDFLARVSDFETRLETYKATVDEAITGDTGSITRVQSGEFSDLEREAQEYTMATNGNLAAGAGSGAVAGSTVAVADLVPHDAGFFSAIVYMVPAHADTPFFEKEVILFKKYLISMGTFIWILALIAFLLYFGRDILNAVGFKKIKTRKEASKKGKLLLGVF